MLVAAWMIATPASAEILCSNWHTREFLGRADLASVSRCLMKNQYTRHKHARTPLHYAAAFSGPQVVNVLLITGANPNARDKNGLTPLHWAALFSKDPYVVKTLLDAGADLAAKDNAGKTPSDYAMMNVALKGTELHKQLERVSCENWNTREFFECASVEEVSHCLEAGSNVTAQNKNGWTPLHIAAGWNKTPAVVTFLIKAGANLNAQDEFGLTPLHWATAFNKNPAIVKALLSAGANPLSKNIAGETPQDFTKANIALKGTDICQRFNKERIKPAKLRKKEKRELKATFTIPFMVSCEGWNTLEFFKRARMADLTHCLKKKNPEARDEQGRTPLHLAVRHSKNPAKVTALIKAGAKVSARTNLGLTPLHVAAANNKTPAIVKILLRAGAKLNVRTKKGWTPLHMAANNKITAALLDAGAKVNARTEKGWTRLHMIAEIGKKPEDVTTLVRAGGDPNAQDEKGLTPLHYAARHSKYPTIITSLINAGANVSLKANHGLTPLHVAAALSKTPTVVVVLLDAGANPKTQDKSGKTPWDYAKQNPALKGTEVYWRLNDARFK